MIKMKFKEAEGKMMNRSMQILEKNYAV